MRQREVVILGGGFSGICVALALARDGHLVSLIERDPFPTGAATESVGWPRRGIPHFLQPHAFIPRGCVELAALFPDVYWALLQNGANEVASWRKMPGPTRPGDEEMRYLAVRRPVIEWALRTAVLVEPRITVHEGARVTGLDIDAGQVVSILIDGVRRDADLVVDALGRRTPTPAWLGEPDAETSDCGVVYYCRYYRQRPGFELPDGPWVLSPRGDLGYIAYASFPGDNRTFAGLLAVPPGKPEWRAVKDPAPFEAAVARIPALASWADPEGVDPITDVLPMAGLRNTMRTYDPARVAGVIPVGDAYCHTDPVLAHGLAFGLVHARALTEALRDHAELVDAQSAYVVATQRALRERFDFATALDAQRLRMWLGEPVDPTRPDGDYALFSMAAAGAVALVDDEVFRAFVRRIGLLDSTAVLDNDLALQQRIATRFGELRETPRTPAGPSRNEMVAVIESAG